MTSTPSPVDRDDAVDSYIAALDGDAHHFATEFRALIHRAAPGITEAFRYKIPCFLIGDRYLVYFGSWKRHLGLYPVPRFDDELEAEVAPYRATSDTVQFKYKDPIPTKLVERILAEMVRRHDPSD